MTEMDPRTFLVIAVTVAIVFLGYVFATHDYGDPARASVERSTAKP
jgi:hypothetical protein